MDKEVQQTLMRPTKVVMQLLVRQNSEKPSKEQETVCTTAHRSPPVPQSFSNRKNSPSAAFH